MEVEIHFLNPLIFRICEVEEKKLSFSPDLSGIFLQGMKQKKIIILSRKYDTYV